MTRLVALLVGALAGLSMAVQGTWNTQLAKVVGRLEANLFVHLVGLLTLMVLLYALRLGRGDLTRLGGAPWYAFLGGILGVVIVLAVVTAMQQLGVCTATTAILVGQILAAAAIDHFGLFGVKPIPFPAVKFLGVALFGVGARILLN